MYLKAETILKPCRNSLKRRYDRFPINAENQKRFSGFSALCRKSILKPCRKSLKRHYDRFPDDAENRKRFSGFSALVPKIFSVFAKIFSGWTKTFSACYALRGGLAVVIEKQTRKRSNSYQEAAVKF